MKSIFEHKVTCTKCDWKGTVGECGDVEQKEGCLDCPLCHSVATDDWDAEFGKYQNDTLCLMFSDLVKKVAEADNEGANYSFNDVPREFLSQGIHRMTGFLYGLHNNCVQTTPTAGSD